MQSFFGAGGVDKSTKIPPSERACTAIHLHARAKKIESMGVYYGELACVQNGSCKKVGLRVKGAVYRCSFFSVTRTRQSFESTVWCRRDDVSCEFNADGRQLA